MGKLLLLSVVIMLVAAPVIAARDPLPRRGLQRAVMFLVAFNVFYLLAVRYIYPHIQ